jgi:hypothetical protein
MECKISYEADDIDIKRTILQWIGHFLDLRFSE